MDFNLEAQFGPLIGAIGYVIEVVGVFIIVVGFIAATLRHLSNRAGLQGDARNREYRHGLALAMLLGLEFLVAGDIIRTVVVDHSLVDVAALGLVVLIRTVLVFTIHLEVEGRWPWQARSATGDD